ncbi:MAG: heparinase II/III family protein [Tepidisphaeraceae bacterium]
MNYFFGDGDGGSVANYVKSHFSTSSQTENADAVTDDRLFPEQSSVTSYTVQLPNAINWNDATKSSNPEFIYALNRQEWWVDLAQSYRYTGNAKYMNELQYELASWSSQNATFTLPDKVSGYTAYGFNFGIRVDNWVMSYFSVLGSDGWTGAANSLFLYKIVQQGDVLNTVAINTTDFTSNRSVSIGKASQLLGEVFPEIDTAAKWESNGRKTIFASMAAQFYADGSHREQSPGYALNVLDDLLEAKQLDKINGVDWGTQQNSVLTNAVDALWQQLSPNGDRPGIGDTYRLSGAGQFTKAALTLGVDRWPEGRANIRDVYVFGTDAVAPYLSGYATTLGDRGNNYSLPDSGNYVMRSGNDTAARQINFTAGPKGGVHGHYNYMGFELFGYDRPLIADPGPYIYDDSDARAWVDQRCGA